ncbi:hypothetical protein SDRG_07026 [Saprolegnia diclina VS20]|uniref:Uncharacterized protein n=1 Tax=Saprolegnia diclina (strain VS20) TaxID=1156394 RepID=T0QNA9_SAPDV|nr:hypothetical protein SDRG_07026 [Saprolegnia diclina VS20]EQC35315.1 hypothetical protein SDRG_07026 [Saprolegnia diclina VS20]|eukprot:XP_008611065.1 hypothetical protein SDRG_07026 [Saprolegnia diclina VS20]
MSDEVRDAMQHFEDGVAHEAALHHVRWAHPTLAPPRIELTVDDLWYQDEDNLLGDAPPNRTSLFIDLYIVAMTTHVPYGYSSVHTSLHPTMYDAAYHDAAASCGLTVDVVFATYKELAKTVQDFALTAHFRTRSVSSGQERSWLCRYHEAFESGASACPFLIKGRKKKDGTVQLRDVVLRHNHMCVLRPLPPGARETTLSIRAMTDIVMQSEVAKRVPTSKLTHKTINKLIKAQVGRKVSPMRASRIRSEIGARLADKTAVLDDGQTKSPRFRIAQARPDHFGHDVPRSTSDNCANCAIMSEYLERSGAVLWPDRRMTLLPRALNAALVTAPSFEKRFKTREDGTELAALAQNKELWTELTETIVDVSRRTALSDTSVRESDFRSALNLC